MPPANAVKFKSPLLARVLSRRCGCSIAVGAVLFGGRLAVSAEPNPATPSDAMALLEAHCVRCHGGDKTKGGLNLMTREALLRGGETGAAVVPGKPDESLLVQMVRHEAESPMPYKEKKLPDAAIEKFVEWVKTGVPYSRELKRQAAAEKSHTGFAISDSDRAHWAFQPIRRPVAPPVQGPNPPVHNAIDRFILRELEKAGLTMSPQASKEQLIRRVTIDLIGLPPTPAEVGAFVKDNSAKAYEKLIDRLLASPQYGERWGRHWLDLARFAETDGFEHDAVRPHSWRYRDYVIRAFNADKPYDRFIREQLAGDELWPDDAEALTATGFNLLGPDMVDSSDQIQRRHNTLNDMTDTASLAFLGLTMGCARCHDHKFEPLSQRDYYSLQAFFAPAKFNREKPIPTPAVQATYDAAMKNYNARPQVKELAEIETPLREKIYQRKLAELSPEAQVAHKTPAEQRNNEQANLVLETEDKVGVSDKEIGEELSMEDRARWRDLVKEVKELPKPTPLPMTMALINGDAPKAKTFVLHRGEYTQPTDEVTPGFPLVLASARINAPAKKATLGRGVYRVALADWIASPENPLTARVMVNRIWRHHFGRGLVATPSDFGTRGQKPTHPGLLDWLASEFMAQGWSLKKMHKLMLMSATYRQSSVQYSEFSVQNTENGKLNARKDPENLLYWRMNQLRTEGEVIRDSLLVISGQLNLKMGGPGVYPPIPKELFQGASGWKADSDAEKYSRRSIYIFSRRNLRFPFLEVFDAPDNNLSCPARERSTTAPQSLTLLNAEEVTTAANATAARLAKEARTPDEQIALAYRLALCRPPTEKELKLAREFLKKSPMSEFCRALFNLNEFVYIN